ncbi:hypothetical protein [Aquipseudomonas alcaligenes]|uniref:Uncharacterized protein n=1 Tax=Aquipseudomonas alcaligenes TaxID=43263 RepID=A0A1N6X7I7_AQUAC|nr:hypothetical protein [Pseudomonas alcaligenes]SIQ98296.1 hypothetical protein SAMN05878282_1125 [Pseudomonas alcaligenes]
MPRFAKLAVRTEFELCCDPASSIYDEVLRTYRMEIFALDGQVDDEGWDTPVSVGHLAVSLARFDVAYSLGKDPVLVADAVSSDLVELAELLEGEDLRITEIPDGVHKDCLVVHSIDIRQDLAGTEVELDAIKTALIGLSTGVSRAFMNLGESMLERPRVLNEATIRYAKIGFRPVQLGSNMLWLNMELRTFWE